MTLDECVYSYEASCGTSTYHKKQPPSHTKITTDVPLWVMHKNQLHERDTSIFDIMHYVNGLNVTSSDSNALIHPSTWHMADHMTKPLTRTLFHRHADFLLGHVPPLYSPVYYSITKMNNDRCNIDQYVPTSFTTPTLAKVDRIWNPEHDDLEENPWIPILWHGEDDNSHLTV